MLNFLFRKRDIEKEYQKRIEKLHQEIENLYIVKNKAYEQNLALKYTLNEALKENERIKEELLQTREKLAHYVSLYLSLTNSIIDKRDNL